MGHVDVNGVRAAVRKKYAEVSHSVAGRFKYLTGRAGALALGYAPTMLDGIGDDSLVAFCGVGNPFALGPLRSGEALLDVGCGAGVDLLIAARLVGPRGRVCGLDLTPEMAARARANLRHAGVPHAEVTVGAAEDMPFEDESFDVVVSNGVLNLSPLKERAYHEVYRVLRPGGRLQFADIVLKEDLAPEIVGDLIAKTGFVGVEYLGTSGFTTSRCTVAALFRARKPSPTSAEEGERHDDRCERSR